MDDLDALADRLDLMIQWAKPTGEALDDLRTAARIVRAVAAAPGPLVAAVKHAGCNGVGKFGDWDDAKCVTCDGTGTVRGGWFTEDVLRARLRPYGSQPYIDAIVRALFGGDDD